MMNIKKIAAGGIALAAITSAPLVAFAAPAFADTGAAQSVANGPSHMDIPPSGYNESAHGRPDPAEVNQQNRAAVPIGTPVSLKVLSSDLQTLPSFLGNVDRHR